MSDDSEDPEDLLDLAVGDRSSTVHHSNVYSVQATIAARQLRSGSGKISWPRIWIQSVYRVGHWPNRAVRTVASRLSELPTIQTSGLLPNWRQSTQKLG
jgi:hypothetical protein